MSFRSGSQKKLGSLIKTEIEKVEKVEKVEQRDTWGRNGTAKGFA